MKIKEVIIDTITGEKKIEELEIEDIIEEIPIEIEPSLEEKIKELNEVNKTQDILIDTTMLATDEIYTMIEPILELAPQNIYLERGVCKMIDMYVAMVQRGLKTIEQVPARYREEVRRILTELEK